MSQIYLADWWLITPHEFPNFEHRPYPAVVVVVATEIEIAKLFASVSYQWETCSQGNLDMKKISLVEIDLQKYVTVNCGYFEYSLII